MLPEEKPEPITTIFSKWYLVETADNPVPPERLDKFIADFAPYIERHPEILAELPLPAGLQHWNFDHPSREKHLEYLLSLDLLDIQKGDTFMDVASCMSVFPAYVKERYGCTVFRQDWYYLNGVKEGIIGGDACRMPLPNESVDKITLHCSFEHFEDTKDKELIAEFSRVLRPGGRAVIIPFYCGDQYQEVVKDNYASGCQFHRYYDPRTFYTRIIQYNLNLHYRVLNISNLDKLGEGLYCALALVIDKPAKPALHKVKLFGRRLTRRVRRALAGGEAPYDTN